MSEEKGEEKNDDGSGGYVEPGFPGIQAAFKERVFRAAPTTIPGTLTKVKVRLLTEAEMDRARLDAVTYIAEIGVDAIVDRNLTLEREERRQILHLAFLFPSGEGELIPFFPSAKYIRTGLDADTVERLFGVYLDHQRAIRDDSLPTEEGLDKVLDLVAEGNALADDLLEHMDALGLRVLLRRAVARFPSTEPGV